jgi:hypothetical protein
MHKVLECSYRRMWVRTVSHDVSGYVPASRVTSSTEFQSTMIESDQAVVGVSGNGKVAPEC